MISIEWILVLLLGGIALAAVGAHPKLCNLELIISLKVGIASGIISVCVYVLCNLSLSLPNVISYVFSVIILGLAGVGIILWRFFRNPERNPPDDADAIVSPADGEIIYIRRIEKGNVPCAIKGQRNISIFEIAKTDLLGKCDGYIIGICMSIHDVHVTRSPISGSLIFFNSFSGKTLSPKNWESEIVNPRTSLLFESKNGKRISVIELGTPYVSKILTYINEMENVKTGQRIGKITWGSQVDVIIPVHDVEICVHEKQRVVAGQTILAKYVIEE